MKTLFSFLFIFLFSFLLVSCKNNNLEENKFNSKDFKEIALVIDIGSIDDKSFNQGTWEGVTKFAEENGISYAYYKSTEISEEANIAAIELAIKGGAKVVVCPGYLFEVPIYKMQQKYPNVKFVLVDGAPNDGNGVYEALKNTVAVYFKEEEAGFLAGYAAVKEGYNNLGFMGGVAQPAVVRFGYGFIQGADYAAKELGNKDNISIRYEYLNNFDASPENTTKASSWYNSGVDIIFACAGNAGNSIMKSAELIDGKKVIGVDVDQSSESPTVITSAMKNLQNSVYSILYDIYNNRFQGGQILNLGTDTGNVLLPIETSKFKNFTQEDYNKIYSRIVNKQIKILNEKEVDEPNKIPTDIVSVLIENR